MTIFVLTPDSFIYFFVSSRTPTRDCCHLIGWCFRRKWGKETNQRIVSSGTGREWPWWFTCLLAAGERQRGGKYLCREGQESHWLWRDHHNTWTCSALALLSNRKMFLFYFVFIERARKKKTERDNNLQQRMRWRLLPLVLMAFNNSASRFP